MKKLNKKGFTLIELIVVIAIIAILAAILIPALLDYITQANRTREQSDSRSAYTKVVLDITTGIEEFDGGSYEYIPDGGSITCTATPDADSDTVVGGFNCVGEYGSYGLPNFEWTPLPAE